MDAEFILHGFYKLMGIFVKGMIRRRLTEDMNRFKELAEQS